MHLTEGSAIRHLRPDRLDVRMALAVYEIRLGDPVQRWRDSECPRVRWD